MKKKRLGTYVKCSVTGESYQAYIPSFLPFQPPLELNNHHLELMEEANRRLGRLDAFGNFFPNKNLFLRSYIRKEALLSSQIEGTQSSFSDLLLYESDQTPGVPLDDVQEVSHYIQAMTYGLKRLREGFPICSRLIKEIHAILLSGSRGSQKSPGEFRRTQNWIGGTRPGNAMFVPPPADQVESCMGNLENFLNDIPEKTPLLIKAALAHVQFETIHPFLDGNGRLGRLLITLLLCSEGALEEPLLYLSLYFKKNRSTYYNFLQEIRKTGDWEAWLSFFLEGVSITAEEATLTAQKIINLFEEDRKKIETLGRAAATALQVHHILKTHPLVTHGLLSKELKVSKPSLSLATSHLKKLGVLEEMTGRTRNQIFIYKNYIEILKEGAEPIH
ncbi:MAG: Fic family protein [Deltaproteobacteria bacterium]|nr:Fic family protein [Deltaproteobacteria bacterium]